MENPEYADIMKYSEFALGEAKNRGRNQVYVFEQEDYDLFLRKRKILAQLRENLLEMISKDLILFFSL